MKSKLFGVLSVCVIVLLFAGCVSTPHAYKGEPLPENELALLWGAGVGGILSISSVNDYNAGGALTAYVKPGINKVAFFFTFTDYSTNIRTNVKWEVSFNCEANHTYVFYPRVADDKQYYILGYDMGTEYAFDENKPLGMVQIEARNKGKIVEFQ